MTLFTDPNYCGSLHGRPLIAPLGWVGLESGEMTGLLRNLQAHETFGLVMHRLIIPDRRGA